MLNENYSESVAHSKLLSVRFSQLHKLRASKILTLKFRYSQSLLQLYVNIIFAKYLTTNETEKAFAK